MYIKNVGLYYITNQSGERVMAGNKFFIDIDMSKENAASVQAALNKRRNAMWRNDESDEDDAEIKVEDEIGLFEIRAKNDMGDKTFNHIQALRNLLKIYINNQAFYWNEINEERFHADFLMPFEQHFLNIEDQYKQYIYHGLSSEDINLIKNDIIDFYYAIQEIPEIQIPDIQIPDIQIQADHMQADHQHPDSGKNTSLGLALTTVGTIAAFFVTAIVFSNTPAALIILFVGALIALSIDKNGCHEEQTPSSGLTPR